MLNLRAKICWIEDINLKFHCFYGKVANPKFQFFSWENKCGCKGVDCCSDVGECRPRPHCHTPPSAPTSLKRSVIFCQMLNFVISGVVFFAKILGVICPENSLLSFLSGPRLSAVHSVGFPGDFLIFSHFLGRFSYFLTFFLREIFSFSYLFWGRWARCSSARAWPSGWSWSCSPRRPSSAAGAFSPSPSPDTSLKIGTCKATSIKVEQKTLN